MVRHVIPLFPRMLGVACNAKLLGTQDRLSDRTMVPWEQEHITCDTCKLYLQGQMARLIFDS